MTDSVLSIKGNNEALNLTVYELEILRAVFRAGGAGVGIKDLRVIHNTLGKLERAIPPRPTPGEVPKAKDEKKPTPEEANEMQEFSKKWEETVSAYNESVQELHLNAHEVFLVKQKLSKFTEFQSADPSVREKIIGLCDKLGV